MPWRAALLTRLPLLSIAHLSYGTINRADWWTSNLNPGTVNCPIVANIDAYEALSDAKPCRARQFHRRSNWTIIWPTTAHFWDVGETILEEKGVTKV